MIFAEIKLTHSQVQRQVSDFLKADGWFVFPNRQDQLSFAGISDLTAIKNGRTVWVEIKTEKDYQKPKQVQFQKDIEEAGSEYFIARGIDDVYHLATNVFQWK